MIVLAGFLICMALAATVAGFLWLAYFIASRTETFREATADTTLTPEYLDQLAWRTGQR